MVEIGRKTVFINAGDVVASRQPHRYTTVLGSCISVCLYDLENCWGGMNHFMHVGQSPDQSQDARWSTPAIRRLLQKMCRLGSNPADLTAKLFGGANVMAAITSRIGERNLQAALTELEIYGIPVLEGSVGGNNSYHIEFLSDTGEVRVVRREKKLYSTSPSGVERPAP
jgi:chemotaxis protein CheD